MILLTRMARNYHFAQGEYYHLYARGFEKLDVFRKDADYQKFIEGLYLFNSNRRIDARSLKRSREGLTFADMFSLDVGENIIEIGAYCLMSNHFHLLVRECNEGGISKFMQKLMTSYTMYFNKKNERTGSIFGSSFKARHVTDDIHLKYLFAYIHLNPGDFAYNHYEYSSYQDYLIGGRVQEPILSKESFPHYFHNTDMIEKEMKDWIIDDENLRRLNLRK